MFIVAPSTMLNAAALETRQLPKRMIGRIAVLPKRGASPRLWLRLLFEMQVLRYLLPLVPFVIAMLIWPRLALPIAQAPVPMVLMIALVEMKVLAMSPDARKRLASEDEIARLRDALRFNATRVLTRLAARRGIEKGEVLLVVEQSELARIAPLTLVSVQAALPEPEVLDLDPQERDIITDGLFDAEFTQRDLQRLTLAGKENLHSVALDVSTISAHARMAAMTNAQPVPAPA